MRKILFLDIDGVCNSQETINNSHKGVIGIDPYMAFLVGKIQLDTNCEVVLSSSWRHHERGREEVRKAVVDFIDITPNCCEGIRGVEIHKWLSKNVEKFNTSWYKRSDELRFAILDDDSDMLLWQKDHFFKTSWQTGLTKEIADKVIQYLNSEQCISSNS